MFICKICNKEYDDSMQFSRDSRYCKKCGEKHAEFLSYRRDTLASLRAMPLEAKIIQTKYLIREAITTFGEDHCYISYSGGKDSTVLSHIAKQMYPNILHLFANTTNEYPETLKHIQWEINENHTNIITVYPIDSKGEMWNFKKVVERYLMRFVLINMLKPIALNKILSITLNAILENIKITWNYLFLINAATNSRKNLSVEKRKN